MQRTLEYLTGLLDAADGLLAESAAAQPEDLQLSEELAGLAFAIAQSVVNPHCVGRADGVRARAWVLLGNSRRLEGDREGAEECFRRAALQLTGPPDCTERAFYCRYLALLRQEQGQLKEAVQLLWRAGRLYRERGDFHEEGLCMAQLGFLFVEAGEGERAVSPLTRAWQTLATSADIVLYLRVSGALVRCRAALRGRGRRTG